MKIREFIFYKLMLQYIKMKEVNNDLETDKITIKIELNQLLIRPVGGVNDYCRSSWIIFNWFRNLESEMLTQMKLLNIQL